jgi:signal transduction histidine kinase
MDRLAQLETVLDCVLEIENAQDEEDAVFKAMLGMEKLKYPNVMIAFLRHIDGVPYIVAEPTLSTGEKFPLIAIKTKRQYHHADKKGSDLLPATLFRNKSRFIIDSRLDEENDTALCAQIGLISQFVIPLATSSTKIGTLQIDMGSLAEEPKQEMLMLEALAAHLSIAIERFRALIEIETLNQTLHNQSRTSLFTAAVSVALHSINSSLSDYAKLLKRAVDNPQIRQNKPALDFLHLTSSKVREWREGAEKSLLQPRQQQEEKPDLLDAEKAIDSILTTWHTKAMLARSKFKTESSIDGHAIIYVRQSAFNEILSCLVSNAVESHARTIHFHIDQQMNPDMKTDPTLYTRISVSDDGDLMSEEDKSMIGKFGHTSKTRGHGMGLTIVKLLAQQEGGELRIDFPVGHFQGLKPVFVLYFPTAAI